MPHEGQGGPRCMAAQIRTRMLVVFGVDGWGGGIEFPSSIRCFSDLNTLLNEDRVSRDITTWKIPLNG